MMSASNGIIPYWPTYCTANLDIRSSPTQRELSNDDGAVTWADFAVRQPQAERTGCLKVYSQGNRDTSPRQRKKKSVTFPLDVLFIAALKEHRTKDLLAILNILVPESFAKQTLSLTSGGKSKASEAVRQNIRANLDTVKINKTSSSGMNAAMLCARAGSFQALRALVVAGTELTHRTRSGWTLFHFVAASGNVEAMKWMLANCGFSYPDMLSLLKVILHDCSSAMERSQSHTGVLSLLKSSIDYITQHLKAADKHAQQS